MERRKLRHRNAMLLAALIASVFGSCTKAAATGVEGYVLVQQADLAKRLQGLPGEYSYLVELTGECQPAGAGVTLHGLSWLPIVDRKTGVEALEERLRHHDSLQIERLEGGVVRIKSPGIWAGLLRTEVKDFELKNFWNYQPYNLIDSLMINPSVRAELRGAGVQTILKAGGMKYPHGFDTRSFMVQENATFEDILIRGLRTFGGITVYSQCVDRKTMYVDLNYFN